VCTRRAAVLKDYEKKYGVKGYTDYRDLLENKEVEAITIATPHKLHSEMAVEAAKAGKHVAVEKPLATSLSEADEMIRAVKKYGVKDLYLENLCFAPSYKMAKE